MKKLKSLFALLCVAGLIASVGCSDGGNSDSTPTSTPTDGSNASAENNNDIPEEVIMASLNNGIVIDEISGNAYKTEYYCNPISTNVFCADPTAVEYEGRLYVYGTNDHQQSEEADENNYEKIKSLVCFSTDDMVNWVYHGRIETGEIAPWIYNSWAPSIVSRVEEDGLTHFYLYFSNNGNGVVVITATSPTGPWSDPLGQPLVYQNMPDLQNCPAPFDPGVVIDENGVGWLSFGGGVPANGDDKVHSNVPKVVKLGADMLSFDSEFVSIDAPYFFEASELNYIDGTYYYTYCTDWQSRASWDRKDIPAPPTCSMAYLTTKTPLDPESWEYRGAYFYNAGQNADGESGMRWANNHTHFMEYQGVNYIFHHTLLLEELKKTQQGFRSMMVEYLPMDTATGEIPITAASKTGVDQIKLLDPYIENSGNVMFTSADIGYDKVGTPPAKSTAKGAWIYVKGADFGYGASELVASVKGKGRIEVRLDDVNSEAVAFIEFDCAEFTKFRSGSFAEFEGRNHDIYFVFSDADIQLESWRFAKAEEQQRDEETIEQIDENYQTVAFMGQAENPTSAMNVSQDVFKDGSYSISAGTLDKESDIINLGFLNTDPEATYNLVVNSLTIGTESGDYEIPIGIELDPRSSSNNGLVNGWAGYKIGELIYGSEECGLFAAETDISWTNFRVALMVDGAELPITSITYNVTISGIVTE